MSGVIPMLLASGGGTTILVTIGGTGPWGFFSGSFGSISPATYKDHGGTSRTILVIDYNASGSHIFFRLSGVITNDATIFASIVVGGEVLARGDATYTTDDSTYSEWSWTVASNILGTSGTVPVQII